MMSRARKVLTAHVDSCVRLQVLPHDAQLATQRLATAGVAVDVWPAKSTCSQLAAPMIPEATSSLRQIGRYIDKANG